MAQPDVRRSSAPSTPLEVEAWPKLDAAALERLRQAGTTREVAAGDVLFDVGQDAYDLVYVERGACAVVDRADDRVVTEVNEGDFMGEIGMLAGQRTFLAGVVTEPGVVILVAPAALRELVSTVPEIGDMIVSAFAARRQLLTSWGQGGLVIVGEESDPSAMALREFVSRNQIPHRWLDRADTAAVAELSRTCDLPAQGSAVVTGRNEVLAAPTTRDLARAIGLDLSADTKLCFDVVVVGAGPAGLAASVYAASEGLSVAVVEDTAIGGQAGTSSRIENYLGFPQGISGADLAYRGTIQAVKFGARLLSPQRVTRLTPSGPDFDLTIDDGSIISARSVILANGVQYRRLDLDRLAEFEGRGVYYAATELEARRCRHTEVVIVGGGNSAGQAAMFLSRYADRTHLVVRGTGLSETMSSYLSDRIVGDSRIQLWTRTEIGGLGGGAGLETVTLRDRDTGAQTDISSRGLFIMIGAAANTGWLDGQLELDARGFVRTGEEGDGGYQTSLPGVFAVGDIRAGSVKRVASAVGEGSVVVSAVHAHLGDTVVAATPAGESATPARPTDGPQPS